VTPARPQTTPHDFRVVCEHESAPTVVGGHAVNLWAINYLKAQVPKENLISKDLDIIVSDEGLPKLKRVPGWVFQPRNNKNWLDSRLGALRSTSPDGRPLLVEILHKVHGLARADLEAAAYIKSQGATYRVLDPVAMLKAKAMNVRDIPQDGPSPRQDRLHLQLIVRCVPEFLRDVHQSAVADPTKQKQALEVFSRAFRTLQDKKITSTLIAEGIAPRSLLPTEFAESPLERISKAYRWQMKMVPEASQPALPASETRPSVADRPRQSPGPRMGM
jgi:hypothetical protein